ncbi:hypothetical protein STSP2_03121 [Anaerohalosphaera lusitana]|uniref:Uncharacterized protein n=1 Tax=Anaerohalosphaera lusitana TaxID=1936003 RepID=A0A1U9NPR8_9BACT|nr:hypothetical protein [Anaerohalosphaera lusitana]AQT69921.1 hypothetical protein STSP2_03121 [Anaerohalosphaera lusitana]
MKEHDFEKMFEGVESRASEAFEREVLANSSRVLRRKCFVRRAVRWGSYAASLLLVGLIAFSAGRAQTGAGTAGAEHDRGAVADSGDERVDEDMVRIAVPREFLAWVDAGRFFTSIQMEDRAGEAFDRAISLVPIEEDMMIAEEAGGDRAVDGDGRRGGVLAGIDGAFLSNVSGR